MEKSYNEIPRKSSTYRTLGGKAFGLIRRAMDPELQFEFDEKKRREQYLSDLAAERQERLARPSFTTLLYNQQYKKWKSGADYSEPYGLELNYDHLDKGKAFELVEAGKLIPDHNVYESIQHHVDPNLSSDRLDQLCRDYCKRTSLTFLANATEIAESFASKGDKNITTTEKLAAIAKLVGTPQSEESTIFTDQSWYIADYKPDFKQLGVDLREIGVDYDKVISGISLCIGLWVQLADSNEYRPVSAKPFAPPFGHCSFTSLMYDTGWTDATNTTDSYLRATFNKDTASELLEPFRDPEFFADIHEQLAA